MARMLSPQSPSSGTNIPPDVDVLTMVQPRQILRSILDPRSSFPGFMDLSSFSLQERLALMAIEK